ncbi:hypothetical protein [Alloactinosynnema sp. L-07]|nr:hypothetical protein [Alloactinosynnema sp. L-07]
MHYLASCRVSHREVEDLVRFCKEVNVNRGYWLATTGPWMCDSLRSLVFHEARATRIVNYQPEMIPGLLQTEPYIQALFSREDIPSDQRQERVNARLERQKVLFRNRPAKFTFIIHERGLRLEVGDNKVMAEQLLAMLFFADRWNISIRVIPAVARHRGIFGGPFVYYDYEKSLPLTYVQGSVADSLSKTPTSWTSSAHSFGRWSVSPSMRKNPGCSSPRWRMSTTGRKALGMTHGGWRKSSFSNDSQTDCVEISLKDDHAGIRDSKNVDGPRLAVDTPGWSAFLTTVKR